MRRGYSRCSMWKKAAHRRNMLAAPLVAPSGEA